MVSAICDSAFAKPIEDQSIQRARFSRQSKTGSPAELVKHLQLDESTLSRNVDRRCVRGGCGSNRTRIAEAT